MKIQTQDQYHGAVLTQITEHSSFKALNKVDSLYGHYLVNHNTRLFVKYLTKESSPWHFKFSYNELQSIQKDLESTSQVFLCLVCGEVTLGSFPIVPFMCIEPPGGTSTIIDWFSFEVTSIKLENSWISRAQTLPHNSFPNKLFGKLAESLSVD
ncbi:hypothetical protein ACWE42_19270 [Sutcliffiella cohnii]